MSGVSAPKREIGDAQFLSLAIALDLKVRYMYIAKRQKTHRIRCF